MEASCRQIVDCLVMNVLKLEQKAVEISDGKVSYIGVYMFPLSITS